MELSQVLNLIKEFLSPVSKTFEQTKLNEITLTSILTSSVENFSVKHGEFYQKLLAEHPTTEVYWQFGLISIRLLTELNNAQFDSTSTGCYLSVNEEKLVATLTQLVVCFCIHYNLEDNIGVSIDKLSKYGVNIKLKRDEIDARQRNIRLKVVMDHLEDIKRHKRQHVDLMKSLFYQKYLSEMVCSLIQLNYSPASCAPKEYVKWLEEEIFQATSGSTLISALLMAQSSSAKINWFSIQVGNLLTKCLLQPNSVMNVIKAILNEINAVSNVSLDSDWKKCDLVAQIVSQCPRSMPVEDYVKLIGPQLLELFFKFDLKYVKHFHRVAGSIYAHFARRWPKLTFEHITKPILSPFSNTDGQFQLTSAQLTEFLANLHLVFVLSTEPTWPTLSQLPHDFIFFLFDIYTLIFKKVNTTKAKNAIESILTLYVKMMPSKQINTFLSDVLKHKLIASSPSRKIQLNMDMFDDEPSDENCDIPVVVVDDSSPIEPATIQFVQAKCSAMSNFIKSLNDPELEIDFLLYLFDELNNFIIKQTSEQTDARSQNDQTFVKLEQRFERLSEEINLKIVYFTQMSSLFETIDPQQIIDKHDRIIDFCDVMLKNLLKLIETDDVSAVIRDEDEYEMIHLLLSLVSVFATGIFDIAYEVKKKLLVLIPHLIELKRVFANTELESMADSLHMSIGTMCGVKVETDESPSTSKRPLIEEINNPVPNDDDYGRAMRDVNDPLLPVKAHGLVVLRKLIDARNERCLSDRDKLIDLFIKNLKNEDSYVYLAGINGLISLVDRDPDRILDILLREYLYSKGEKLDVENRLKIGEVLTKTVKNFNELVPKYAPKLINAFLVGCKHKDELFRASSLSNLGETCKLLKYSLSANIYEILNCLSSLIDTDSSAEVKRSASMVLKMIIEGLRKENFLPVLGNSLAPLYKLLVRVKSTTNDDVVRLNCELTGEYLNELVKDSMFPKQTLQKEIKILRP